MHKQRIFDVIVSHAKEVVPRLHEHRFEPTDSLRELGANSVDRADIIVMTLETLGLRVPLATMARAQTIGELADIIHERA